MNSMLEERSRSQAIGYQMINSAEIRNFRCLEEVDLRDCRRVNVILGDNASGKTAVLESLFLAVGPSPEVATRLRLWRGFEPAMSGTFDVIDEAMWGNLFHRYNLKQDISVNLQGTSPHNRNLIVTYGANIPSISTVPEISSDVRESAIQFSWVRGEGQPPIRVRPVFTGTGYNFPGAESGATPSAFFASAAPFPNAENVRRFSDLKKSKKHKPLIEAARSQFPFIESIDILTHAGVAMLHADLPNLPESTPLSSISSGVNKFVCLLLAIADHTQGMICVDEIENGFHYTKMESIWRIYYDFCTENDVQLFVSTHSKECLEALARACKDNSDDISFIRLSLDKGKTIVEQFRGTEFFPSIQYGEVR